uniref:Endophilin-A1 n=1 Tax=Lepeophtheirus salmonis TaxID=72036 RepID=D3PIT3_LEPSM|nr:Endophilin-A1 [Lepeophtheirus salmonis]
MFESFKRKLIRTNQVISESISGSEKSEAKGEVYAQYSKNVNAYKKHLVQMLEDIDDLINPNSNLKSTALTKIQKLNGTQEEYVKPHVEHDISTHLDKISIEMGENDHYSLSLKEFSKCLLLISELKYESSSEVKSIFNRDVHSDLNDIQDILKEKKILEDTRLDWCLAKKEWEKKKASGKELVKSENDFKVQLDTTTNKMRDFMLKEEDRIDNLTKTAEILAQMHKKISEKFFNLEATLELKKTQSQDSQIEERYPASRIKPLEMKCKAIHDYKGEEGDLSFMKGDVIKIIEKLNENWYAGIINGIEGQFPTNHVEIL